MFRVHLISALETAHNWFASKGTEFSRQNEGIVMECPVLTEQPGLTAQHQTPNPAASVQL